MDEKEKILEAARKSACDVDGDVITVDGKNYYVHLFDEICEELTNVRGNLSPAR